MSGTPDIFEAIGADLSAAQTKKRRHFIPAIVIVAIAIGGLLAMLGLRSDFASMPAWRQASFVASWFVCLLLFPAVGVGLWFPSRGQKVALATVGVLLPVTATLGWPIVPAGGHAAGPCAAMTLSVGVVLVGVGAVSGAFAQRRSRSSTVWVATGLALASLVSVSCACPISEIDHLVFGHFAPAAGLAALGVLLGRWLHARMRG
ncbi:MAG: hypothetical protein AAGA54_16920 [Myxococcota bacterium]